MQKFSLELPKYRLQLHMRLVRRRKPLVSEPLLPSIKTVNRKYRSGTLIGKFIRHLTGHKNARKVFAGNMAAFAVITSFIPAAKPIDQATPDSTVIETQNTLNTEKSLQEPISQVKINQTYSFFHPGIDFGAEIGDSIKPMKAGIVVFASYTSDGYGNQVVIDHGQGLTTRYAHLSKIEVEDGEKVTTETEIGRVGVTGHTTGPHLHFEVRLNGVAQNPFAYLPAK